MALFRPKKNPVVINFFAHLPALVLMVFNWFPNRFTRYISYHFLLRSPTLGTDHHQTFSWGTSDRHEMCNTRLLAGTPYRRLWIDLATAEDFDGRLTHNDTFVVWTFFSICMEGTKKMDLFFTPSQKIFVFQPVQRQKGVPKLCYIH